MENPNALALLFQDKYKHDNKNPRTGFNNHIGRKDDYHVRNRQLQEKVEREKRKLESEKEGRLMTGTISMTTVTLSTGMAREILYPPLKLRMTEQIITFWTVLWI